MTDVFPRRNLPGDSDVWGRGVETRVIGVEGAVESLGQLVQGQNRNTASSLEVLAGQIRALSGQVQDLGGRLAYSVDGTGTTQTWTSLQPNDQPFGPSVTFTLNEARVVSIQFSVNVTVEAKANDVSSYVATGARGMVFVDSAGVGGSRGEVGVSVNIMPAPPVRVSYLTSTIICQSLVTLAAGSHTVRGGFNYRNVQIVGSGSGEITASDPNVFVDVLQPSG